MGRKTIECRLSRTARVPFQAAHSGEIVWLKESGGPIYGRALIGQVMFVDQLTARKLAHIHRRYNRWILADDAFWRSRRNCRYLSLIWLEQVQPVVPFRIDKNDRHAWVCYEPGAYPAWFTADTDSAQIL